MGKRADKRRKARLERKRLRQESRNQRIGMRQETTQYMASQGMRKGQVVGDLVSKGLDLAGSKFGATSPDMVNAEANLAAAKSGEAGTLGASLDQATKPLVYGAIALAAYMLLGKKKRR